MGIYRDLTGERYGRLTVVRHVDRPQQYQNRQFWLVQCDCGEERVMSSSEWNRHARMSCGCYQRESASKRAFEQHLTHGKTGTRLYAIWSSMIRRCETKSCKEYPLYGGRGISVCDEWRKDFTAFEKWMLEHGYDDSAPRGQCTLDRKDNDGNYCPENCRVATQKEQSRNRRSNRLLTYNGVTKTMVEWAEEYGLSVGTLRDRLSYGWSIEECLTKPLRHW